VGHTAPSSLQRYDLRQSVARVCQLIGAAGHRAGFGRVVEATVSAGGLGLKLLGANPRPRPHNHPDRSALFCLLLTCLPDASAHGWGGSIADDERKFHAKPILATGGIAIAARLHRLRRCDGAARAEFHRIQHQYLIWRCFRPLESFRPGIKVTISFG